jgi:hypothetical protein
LARVENLWARPSGHAEPPTTLTTAERTLHGTVWRIGTPLLITQAAVLIVLNVVQYHRFALSFDFATYYQAWWLIGHGHLNPLSTTLGIRFVANDFELLMWPLALLTTLSTSPLVLLVVEDFAVVATNAVTLSWALAVLEGSGLPLRRRQTIAAFALVSLLLNPWCYETALWAFHPASVVALLAVLAGRDLWRHANRRLLLWSPLLLLTGLIGLLSVVGLGITALLLGRRGWHVGLPLLILGLGLLLVLGQVHLVGAGGTYAGSAFGYLVPHHRGATSAVQVIAGLVQRPRLAATVLAATAPVVLLFLLPTGPLGAVSRWAIGMELTIILPPALAASAAFGLGAGLAFQVWPALPFVLLGTVMFLGSTRWPRAATGRAVPLAAGTCFLVTVLTAVTWLPYVFSQWVPPVAPGATKLLGRLQRSVSPRDELVVWAPVAGRFAARADLRAIVLPEMTIPVDRRVVTVILAPGELGMAVPLADADTFARRLVALDHATLVERRDGVTVLRWYPSPAVRSIDFPSAALNTSGPREFSIYAPPG